MSFKVPFTELHHRMNTFHSRMDATCSDWELAIIVSKVNQFYFTGTMQDGMLLISRGEKPIYFCRRSYERAVEESLFGDIRPMESYRDVVSSLASVPETVYLETEIMPIAMYQRMQKHIPFKHVKPLDAQLSAVRSVKSHYEIDLMEHSGRIHAKVLEELVPNVLKEGMSELDLASEVSSLLLKEGHHGISRFGMFDTDMLLGQIGFGESSIYPTFFNGPGGTKGMNPAVPLLGSRERRLKKGDLVFVDVGCGYNGYHTDKTVTYMFGKPLSNDAIAVHKKCVDIQDKIAEMLKPSQTPSHIYKTIMHDLDEEFLKNFMGFGNRKVKFLGHGIGLVVDETPVIAEGFDQPIQDGMTFAIEPKKGIESIGMVGIENTFLVTADGGKCITGNNKGLILV